VAPTVEPATLEDLAFLAEPLAALPLFVPYGLTGPTLRDRWAKAHAHGEGFLVAKEGAERLGLAWFLKTGTFGPGAFLKTLALMPGAQGKGVGAALLTAFEHACGLAFAGFFVMVSDFNPRAVRFYARHGYEEVGRLPGFSSPTVAEILLWKRSPTQVS
jgi:ribosomal protein S18 acetylase RimI-like enzyme